MKKDSEEKPKQNSMKTLVLFCVIVAGIIIISFIYRIFVIVQHTKFDGQSSIIVSVVQDDRKKAAVYSFDPVKQRVFLLHISGEKPLPDLRGALSLPIEGEVTRRSLPTAVEYPLTFSGSSWLSLSDGQELTILDVFRLWYMTKTLPDRQKLSETLRYSEDSEVDEELLNSLFVDSLLESDKQTIAIVNGTKITGLGGRLEKMINRIGGNVISITTAHSPIQSSRILISGDSTYTVKKLQRITGFPIVESEETGVSDILIELGEDSQRTEEF